MADVISYVQGPGPGFLKLSLLRQRRHLWEPGDNTRLSLPWGLCVCVCVCIVYTLRNGKGVGYSLARRSTADIETASREVTEVKAVTNGDSAAF